MAHIHVIANQNVSSAPTLYWRVGTFKRERIDDSAILQLRSTSYQRENAHVYGIMK